MCEKRGFSLNKLNIRREDQRNLRSFVVSLFHCRVISEYCTLDEIKLDESLSLKVGQKRTTVSTKYKNLPCEYFNVVQADVVAKNEREEEKPGCQSNVQ